MRVCSIKIESQAWMDEIDRLEKVNHCFKRDHLAKCYNSKIERWITKSQCCSTVRVNKYYPGDFLGLHCDNSFSDESTHVVVVYLNDDFEGGELMVFDDRMSFLKKVKPVRNMAIIFPITYYHSTIPISRGVKYCLSFQCNKDDLG